MRRALSLLVLAVGTSAGLSVACDSDDAGSICGPTQAEVVRVIDGDTVELADGQRVRYLLVDTPEVTGGKDECYGAEARDFNQQTVEGKTVTLIYDEQECTDRYDRLLAFVEVAGRDVNALLIERGFAQVLYIAPSGEDRKAEYEGLQARAEAGLAGQWGACQDD